MSFPIDSLYEIREKGKPPLFVKVINCPLALHQIKVVEIESGKENYLLSYLNDDVEINPISKIENIQNYTASS